jgi:hypothetical protein
MDGGERVIVGDEVVGVALVLELERGLHHAEEVADVESSAGLEAGKDAHGMTKEAGSGGGV